MSKSPLVATDIDREGPVIATGRWPNWTTVWMLLTKFRASCLGVESVLLEMESNPQRRSKISRGRTRLNDSVGQGYRLTIRGVGSICSQCSTRPRNPTATNVGRARWARALTPESTNVSNKVEHINRVLVGKPRQGVRAKCQAE